MVNPEPALLHQLAGTTLEGAARSNPPPAASGSPTLVVQTAFLGDVVLTIPLLARLAARHGPVDVVTTPAAAPLVETHPAVRATIAYDKKGADRGWSGFLRLLRRVRAGGYCRAYLPHQSWRSAALVRLAGIAERIGFAESPAAVTYTRRVPAPTGTHAVTRFLALGGPDGSSELPQPWLALTEEDRRAADAWLATHGVSEPFLAVAPGSIWGAKRWPYFPELCAGLDLPVVVVGGPPDRALAETVARRAPGRILVAAGALSLRESAAVLRRATALVTNDSAPLHLATAVGTPVVAIFGPTVPAFGFGPLRPEDLVVEHPGLDCRPCSHHGPKVCPLGHHRCMTEVPVGRVEEALTRVLSHREERRAVHRRD
jgi:heptosyltransferase-2